jgi:hypothetical protein
MKAIKVKAMGRNKFQAAINLDPSCVMNDKKKWCNTSAESQKQ